MSSVGASENMLYWWTNWYDVHLLEDYQLSLGHVSELPHTNSATFTPLKKTLMSNCRPLYENCPGIELESAEEFHEFKLSKHFSRVVVTALVFYGTQQLLVRDCYAQAH